MRLHCRVSIYVCTKCNFCGKYVIAVRVSATLLEYVLLWENQKKKILLKVFFSRSNKPYGKVQIRPWEGSSQQTEPHNRFSLSRKLVQMFSKYIFHSERKQSQQTETVLSLPVTVGCCILRSSRGCLIGNIHFYRRRYGILHVCDPVHVRVSMLFFKPRFFFLSLCTL